MQDSHKKKAKDVLRELGTAQAGLGESEVRARAKQYGPNTIPTKGGPGVVRIFVSQLTSPLMIILIVAIAVSLAIGEPGDAIVIGLAVAINAVVGFVQEWKAESAAQTLKSYEQPHARVRRGGRVIDVEASSLVPGDIVLLSSGSRVPADVRLIKSIDLAIDESLLTGESYPVEKNTEALDNGKAVGDRVNMGFFGTMVSRGRGEGVVVAVGAGSELGKIAKLVVDTKDEITPLQKQIKKFSWILGVVVVGLAALMFVIGLARGTSFEEMLSVSVALAVASIPEGLVVAFTVVLAIGMQKMLKRRSLVRRLVAAETLGSVSVVCTDKTGTITEGKMSVVEVVSVGGKSVELLEVASLNNDVEVRGGEVVDMGHPTERALVNAALEAGIDVEKLRGANERIQEVPFSGEIKYMVTVHRGDQNFVAVKGAPEKVLKMCALSEIEMRRVEDVANDMTKRGLRVLAFARREGESIKDISDMRYLGIVGIADKLRPNVDHTIKELTSAGIKTVIITGDHPQTAVAIAREAGLEVGGIDDVLVGAQVDELSDAELFQKVRDIRVFARVEPKHKVRIVKAWREHKETVAMLGDGVNDAAAMKAADIGVALGSGTDVAKETSDMVLLDNNLASIVASVKEGRSIFDNMRKIIVYLVSDSSSEIVLIGGALLLGLPLPILAVQILWINFVADGFPNLALTVEPPENDVMERPPRPVDEPLLNSEMKALILLIGLVTDVLLFGLFMWSRAEGYDIEHIRTLMFTALAIDSLIYVYAVRSIRKSIIRYNPFRNKWLNIAVLFGLVTQIAVIYVPALQNLFSTVPLDSLDWTIVLVLGVVEIVVIEAIKEFFSLISKRRKKKLQTA